MYIYMYWYTSTPLVLDPTRFEPTQPAFRWKRSDIINLTRTMSLKQRGERKKTDELKLLAFLQELSSCFLLLFSLIIIVFRVYIYIFNIYVYVD